MGNEAESLGLRAKREALVSDDVLRVDRLLGIGRVSSRPSGVNRGVGTRGRDGGSATLNHGDVVPAPRTVSFHAVDHDDLAGRKSKVCHASKSSRLADR